MLTRDCSLAASAKRLFRLRFPLSEAARSAHFEDDPSTIDGARAFVDSRQK